MASKDATALIEEAKKLASEIREISDPEEGWAGERAHEVARLLSDALAALDEQLAAGGTAASLPPEKGDGATFGTGAPPAAREPEDPTSIALGLLRSTKARVDMLGDPPTDTVSADAVIRQADTIGHYIDRVTSALTDLPRPAKPEREPRREWVLHNIVTPAGTYRITVTAGPSLAPGERVKVREVEDAE